MGVVYRAEDLSQGRTVALKLMLSRSGGIQQERFVREALLTASLRHPGIVVVHDAGEADGVPYIAYELVEGARSFEELASDRTVSVEQKLSLVSEAGRALGFAHEQGVIHRDVKPANLLVDAAGRVRVLDFGLAAAVELERLTQTGALLGTPSYMAPEQILPREKTSLDPTCDVWALGVVLYEFLTGSLPFSGGNVFELASQIKSGSVQAPRARDSSISRFLEAVCLKALRLEPSERYANGTELADDLDRALAGDRPLAAHGRRRGLGLWVGLVLGSLAALVVAVSFATTPVAETPKKSATPNEAKPAPEIEDGEADWQRVIALERITERVPAVWAWLRTHPNSKRTPEAVALLDTECRSSPVAVLPLDLEKNPASGLYPAVYASWTDDGSVLAWGNTVVFEFAWPAQARLHRWPVIGGRPLGVGRTPQGVVVQHRRVLHRLPDSGKQVSLSAKKGSSVRCAVVDVVRNRLVRVIERGGQEWLNVLDLETQTEREGAFRSSFDPIHMDVSADGAFVAVVEGQVRGKGIVQGFVSLWRLSDLSRVRGHRLPSQASALAFHPERPLLAVATSVGTLDLFELPTLERAGSMVDRSESQMAEMRELSNRAHGDVLRGLAFDPSRGVIYSVGRCPDRQRKRRGDLFAWSIESKQVLWKAKLTHDPYSVRLSPDRRTLAIGSRAAELEVWALRSKPD